MKISLYICLVETSLLILGLVSTIAIPRILLLSCKNTMPLAWVGSSPVGKIVFKKKENELPFKTEKLRDKFEENFEDLILKAKPLL